MICQAALTEVTRSHFQAEARIERAAKAGDAGGWLGRWLKTLPEGGELPALAVGTTMPGALDGHAAAAAEQLGNLILAGGVGWHPL